MRTVKRILGFSIVIIMFIYSLYVTYMIVKNSDPADLVNIDSAEDLDKHLEPHMIRFYETNKIWLHLINGICWVIFLKLIL